MTPKIGQLVKLVGDQTADTFDIGRIVALHDDVNVWWDTPHGEDKMALMEALEHYGAEKAKTAEWYAEIVSIDDDGMSMAVASFEVELVE